MKKILIPVLIALYSVAFFSCSDDNDTKVIDQQRDRLQNEADKFLSEINDLNTLRGTKVLKTFADLCREQPPFESNPEVPVIRSAQDIVQTASQGLLPVGKLTWNSDTRTWTMEASEILEFYFPETGTGTTNNAQMILTTTYGELMPFLPTNAELIVSANDEELGKATALMEFAEGLLVPQNTTINASFGEYTAIIAGNVTSNASGTDLNEATAAIKKGSTSLIDAKVDLKANLSNILEIIENPELLEIENGNVDIKIMNNLRITGAVHIGAILEQEAIIDATETEGTENYAKKLAEVYNKYAAFNLKWTNNNSKMADVKFRYGEKTEDDESYWDVIPYFEFDNESTSDIEDFFSTGFEDFLQNWAKFIQGFDEL